MKNNMKGGSPASDRVAQFYSNDCLQNHTNDIDSKKNANGIFSILEANDIIKIRPSKKNTNEKEVKIEGEVFYPGQYVISIPNEKITDIIKRAGGLKVEAYPRSSVLIRNDELIKLSFNEILRNPRSKLNFSVSDGDIIKISKRPNLVKVEGSVNNPGNFQFIKGSRLNDYLKMSGGLTQDASKQAIFVIYPDGSSVKPRFYKYSPRIIDGSIIKVGKKEEVEPFNFTEYVTSLTSIYADLMQAYLMIRVLGQDNNS